MQNNLTYTNEPSFQESSTTRYQVVPRCSILVARIPYDEIAVIIRLLHLVHYFCFGAMLCPWLCVSGDLALLFSASSQRFDMFSSIPREGAAPDSLSVLCSQQMHYQDYLGKVTNHMAGPSLGPAAVYRFLQIY